MENNYRKSNNYYYASIECYTCTRHSITSEHLVALTPKITISVYAFRIITTRKRITVTFIYICKKEL